MQRKRNKKKVRVLIMEKFSNLFSIIISEIIIIVGL